MLKKDENAYQQELSILQDIIKQFNKFSNRNEIAAILKQCINLLEEKPVDIGSLRTQLLHIFNNEESNVGYNELFYDALFVFLLLLAKYHPTNNLSEGFLQCPIKLENINPDSRLLTTQGNQFDHDSLAEWLKDHITCPTTNKPFSLIELCYLYARRISEIPEIPELTHPLKISLTRAQKIANYWDQYVASIFAGGVMGGLYGVSVAGFFNIFIPLGLTAWLAISGGFIIVGALMEALPFIHHFKDCTPTLPSFSLFISERPHIKADQCGKLLMAIRRSNDISNKPMEEKCNEINSQAVAQPWKEKSLAKGDSSRLISKSFNLDFTKSSSLSIQEAVRIHNRELRFKLNGPADEDSILEHRARRL